MSERRRTGLLILIMAFVAVVLFAVRILYMTALQEERLQLVETAQSQVRLIEAVSRFTSAFRKERRSVAGRPANATLSVVADAHSHYGGFGKTGENTLAKREGDLIVFLLGHRHAELEQPEPVPFDSCLSEPMRLALSGKSGTFTILVILAGTGLFFRITKPITLTLEQRASDLERTNRELERQIAERRRAEEELRRLASIVSSSDDAIIGETLDGIIISWNKGAEKMYGYGEKEVLGKPVSVLVPANRPDEVPGILEKIKAGESMDHFETVGQKKDGSLLDISLSISPIKDDAGEIVGASAIARDVTEHKKSDKALEESERRFRRLVENSLTGISIIQDDQVVYQNAEQERLLGPLPRPTKLTDLESIHPEDRDKVAGFYENIRLGEAQNLELDFRFFSEGGSAGKSELRWVYSRASSIDYQGKQAVLINIMDITRYKELENLLMIQDKMASLGRVAAGIAHEIRNPLSGINVYLNTLEKIYNREEGRDKVKKILEKLQSASDKIELVIRRVMDFSKPSSPEFVPVDINRPFREAVSLTATTLRKRGIKTETAFADDLPLCRADPSMIEQVILNLITNAAEAMKDEAGEKRIHMRSSSEGRHVVIRISDTGPGIPLHLRDKVFDPFYSTKNGSTGIGLSLAHRIIADHQGFLGVSENRWGGAEFTVKIPVEYRKT